MLRLLQILRLDAHIDGAFPAVDFLDSPLDQAIPVGRRQFSDQPLFDQDGERQVLRIWFYVRIGISADDIDALPYENVVIFAVDVDVQKGRVQIRQPLLERIYYRPCVRWLRKIDLVPLVIAEHRNRKSTLQCLKIGTVFVPWFSAITEEFKNLLDEFF